MTKLDKIPLGGPSLDPTRAFYIQGGNLTDFTVFSLPESTASSTFLSTTSLPQLLAQAKTDAVAEPPLFRLEKPSFFSTALTARDASGAPVATISGATLTLGRRTLTFAEGSPLAQHHAVNLAPVSHASRADEFIVDSVPFLWDIVDRTKRCELSKVVNGMRVEVGRFVAKSPRDKVGVLVVDGREVDELLAALTCVTVLNRMDSFRF